MRRKSTVLIEPRTVTDHQRRKQVQNRYCIAVELVRGPASDTWLQA